MLMFKVLKNEFRIKDYKKMMRSEQNDNNIKLDFFFRRA